ncbi:uncharacterized protein LOC117242787 [Bombus vosnesenskii]|uniref:Uncharacterized protein LOC117242787 n=1 Tax=Bombus vosnesenskii TaxID=207650 RepID=A0A6J3LJB2_9HYME|nr:uncharacterized protein LOC117242787 [Bombus vosnesenskii]
MALLTLLRSLCGIFIFSSLLVAAYLFVIRKYNYWSKRGIIQLKPTPVVGNFMDCILSKKSGAQFLSDAYNYGKDLPLLGFYIFHKPCLLVRDPELAKHILVKDFEYFADRYATADEKNDRLGYANMILMKNPAWKSLRPKMTPIFTPGKLKKMFMLMAMIADDLGKYLDSLHLEGDGKAIEFKDICASFATDMISGIAFGLKLNSLENPKTPFRECGRRIFDANYQRNMEFLTITFMPQLSKYLKPKFFGKIATKFFQSVFWDVIEQRVVSGQKRHDLIDVLAEIRETYKSDERLKNYNFEGDDLVAQAAIFFAAGFETSAATMSFTLYELARNSDVQQTLRKEILDALEKTDGEITYDMITTLPYLDMILFETLRKYPSVPNLNRVTLADYKVPNSDLVIEKGTPIFISIMGLHYDSRYFPNPEKYDPLRFTEEVKSTRPSFAYLPFGAGPRICLGMRLGLMQAKLGIVQILKDYEISPCEKTKIPIVTDPNAVISTALGGVHLNIRKTTASIHFTSESAKLTKYNRHFFLGRNESLDSSKMALLSLYWSLDGILILSTLMIAAYLYMTRKFNHWPKRGITQLAPTPFVGNFMDCLLSRKSGSLFIKDVYDCGEGLPLLGFYVFDKPYLLVRDPELVKYILVKDFDYFPDKYATADEKDDRFGYANVVLMKNPGWKSLRPKMTPSFTPGKLKKMFDIMLVAADDLGKHLDSLHLEGDGKVVEFKDICANFTTDMIGGTAFGLKLGSLENPKAPFREYGRKIFHSSFHRNMESLIISFSPQLAKYLKPKFFGEKATNFLRSVFWDVIEQRVASGQKRNDLIDVLIEIRKTYKNDENLKDYKFDGDDLLAQAAILFAAGFETSSTTMSFTLHELAVNPDVQKTLRAEIQDALEKTDGKITYDMITTLPYLDMVISESLRKYPAVAYMDRLTLADYKVPNSDLVIEKGTPIFISIMGLHYDSRYFPDPEKYDPLRFTEEVKSTRPSFAYLPFGGGPRGCIGMRLGLMQSKLGVVQILKDYEISPCEKTKTPIVLDPKGIITTALGGVHLNIRKTTVAV